MSEVTMQHTVRDFWDTRPRRRSDQRKIAGVAAAIGRRYAIDPVLVRVAFLVATVFGGSGVLLYLVGWLLLPAEGDEASAAESIAGRGRSSMPTALTIVLVVLLILAIGAVLILAIGTVLVERASGLLGLVITLGALVLLHRSRATLGEIPGSSTRAEPSAAPTPQPAQATGNPAAAEVPGADRPAPLGAAPFAGDLPEPATLPAQTPAAHSVRSKVTPVTLGLALLIGGLAVAFSPALSAVQIAALLLGVVGLGLVLGAFVQGGRGLIFLAVPLALLTWVLHVAPSSDIRFGGRYWDPVTAAQVQPHYAITLGNGRLELAELQLAAGQTVKTSVAVGIGQTHVYLPPNVDAQVSCQTQVGQVDCLGRTGSRVTVTDTGPDGPGGGTLILDVRSGIGQVHVERD